MESYVDTSKLYVEKIPKPMGKKMIEKYHYTHAWTSCRYALGLFYDTGEEHQFFAETEKNIYA